MKKFRASIAVSDGWNTKVIEGEGDTPQEAKNNCSRKITDEAVVVERLSESVSVPLEVAKTMPKRLPKKQRLFLFVRLSHNSGEAYDWRMFAIDSDASFKLRRDYKAYESDEGSILFEAGLDVGEYAFTDCNAEYEFHLPPNSKEFVDGKWIACEVAQYSY